MTPLRLLNTRGIPAIESKSAAVNVAGTVVVTFNSHPYVRGRFAGGFWVKIGQTVVAGTENVQFVTDGVPDSTYTLYLPAGTEATAADIASDGNAVHLCFFDSDNNRLTLVA